MKPEDDNTEIGGGYAFGQLARAFDTARQHDDPATRERALRRVDQWTSVLKGMASGRLRIGSRTPVQDLPAWVTPEVVRGGFATGAAAAASNPLEPWEQDIVARAGTARTRAAVFAYLLGEAGLAELDRLLTSGAYEIAIPEDAALLTIAWLIGAGHVGPAIALAETITPFAERLCFVARPAEPDTTERSIVSRQTVRATGQALHKRRPNERVESMREALTVWNPFADELLAHWLETQDDGRFDATRPTGWEQRGFALLQRYEDLAARHTRCTKHRNPKQNVAILRAALEDALVGEIALRRRGKVQHAVNAMLARRGAPGSPAHVELRAAQATNASIPAQHALARVVVRRLAGLPQLHGLASTDDVLAPVRPDEADGHGVPAGAPIPASVRAVVERALAATPEVLIARGVVGSAEVLAELVPRIAASTVAQAYADERLRTLMAATYEAFRRRRTLLLTNLEHQVRFDELPWVQAVAPFRARREHADAGAIAALARLAELAIEAFPATIMPSPLVSELDVLARAAGLPLPLVEELAADIFMGTFSAKFLRAAKLAGELLEGSLYARYYGIDYAAITAIDDVHAGRGARTSAAFDALCFERARTTAGGFSVARNGTVIEQAQILTTHNLAVLTGPAGVGHLMTLDWDALARRCLERVLVLAARLQHNPRPLRTAKDLAYAWRQLVFFLAMTDAAAQAAFVAEARRRLEMASDHVVARLEPVVDGLEEVMAGRPIAGWALLGWCVGRHPLLATPE
jgi:hypothetical protein